MPYYYGRGESGGWGLLSGSLYGFRPFACFFPTDPVTMCVPKTVKDWANMNYFVDFMFVEGRKSFVVKKPGTRLLSSNCCAIAIPLPLIPSLRASPGPVSTPSEGGHSSTEGSGDWKASFGRCRRALRRYCTSKLAQIPKHRKFGCFLSARAEQQKPWLSVRYLKTGFIVG